MSDLTFVHRFIAAENNSTRTLLLLHGTGGHENDLLDLGRSLDTDAALLSPRGKVLENGAPRFFRRLAEGVFDEADLIARAHELADFVEAAAVRYKIDLNNLVAVGYSNGANIAAAMILLGVAKFSRAILFRPMVPLDPTKLPDLRQVDVLLCAGEFDPIARPPIVKNLAELLRRGDAKVALTFQPSGHELTPPDVLVASRWLASAR